MIWAVLLVDDNASIRRCIRVLFEEESNFEVVAEAEHGLEAIEKAKFHKPHLIVLDFQMPVMNGMEAAPKIREHLPNVCIIMLTMFGNDELEATARERGIHAFVLKSNAATQLIPAAQALFERMTPAVKSKSNVA